MHACRLPCHAFDMFSRGAFHFHCCLDFIIDGLDTHFSFIISLFMSLMFNVYDMIH